MKSIIVVSAALIFAIFLLIAFGPEHMKGLFAGVLIWTLGAAISATVIIAGCMLAKRLGYEQISGLLLLVPGVNVLVFFYWAFRESPNERQIRILTQRKASADPIEPPMFPSPPDAAEP